MYYGSTSDKTAINHKEPPLPDDKAVNSMLIVMQCILCYGCPRIVVGSHG